MGEAEHNRASLSPHVVVFDVGNVLLRWDPRFLYSSVFSDEAQMEWFLETICTPAWNLEQDRGRSFAQGVDMLIARHPEWASQIRAFDERWQEMVPHAIEDNVRLLSRLKWAGVPVYAITNFSREKFAQAQTRFAFLNDFDGVVVSALEGLVKPDPAIYRLFCARYGLAAHECLFIDDSPANVEGAREVGMHAILYRAGDDLAAALRSRGIPL